MPRCNITLTKIQKQGKKFEAGSCTDGNLSDEFMRKYIPRKENQNYLVNEKYLVGEWLHKKSTTFGKICGPKRTERSKLRSQNLSEQIALWVSKLQKEVRGHIIVVKSSQSDLCRLKLQILIM